VRVIRHKNLCSSSVSTAPPKAQQTWRHPGGKLVELGSHALKQDELLAILIGAGVPGRSALAIANAVLDQYCGLYALHRWEATVEDLARIPGVGRDKALRILAAVELGRRLHRLWRSQKSAPKAEGDLLAGLDSKPKPEPAPQGPTDADLLATIIGSGIRGRPPKVIAEDLLARFGSVLGLFDQDMGDFLSIRGLNSTKIIRICATLEIAKRIALALS